MNTEIEIWTVKNLIEFADTIELNPAYQRGPAWTDEKQALLVDSVFRKYDLPKIYLARKGSSSPPRYEVIDGQQRVRALLRFANGKLKVPKSSVGGGASQEKVDWSGLSPTQIETFLGASLTFATIDGANGTYKRTLFARLQLGERLNPAELRNALPSSIPRELRATALSHPFFESAAIKDSRYKRDDYLTHVWALLSHGDSTKWKDIKAPALKQFVLSHSRGLPQELLARSEEILDRLEKITRFAQKALRNKWSFVDAFMFCDRTTLPDDDSSVRTMARLLKKIEDQRRAYYKKPDALLEDDCRVPHRRKLYDYIMAYKAGGAVRENIEARAEYLDQIIGQ